MKRTLTGRIALAVCIVALIGIAAFAYNVNDKVKVDWKGGLYPATILKAEKGKFLIHYDGYASSWDEWVTADRIKGMAGAEFEVGQTVKVLWKGTWYPATVLKANNGKYLIHYKGFGSNWDEWVGTGRIKK